MGRRNAGKVAVLVIAAAAVAVWSFVFANIACADVWTSQQNETHISDSFMQENLPTTNYNANQDLQVTRPAAGQVRRSVINWKFSFADTLAGAVVDTAQLILKQGYNNCFSGTVGVYLLTTAFTASTVTWNTPWTTAGGDFDATLLDSQVVPDCYDGAGGCSGAHPNTGCCASFTWDITSAMQDWIDGVTTQNGLIVKLTSEASFQTPSFFSAASTTAAWRPYFRVVYTVPASGMNPQTAAQSAAKSPPWRP